jgi:hypothetical protein
MKRLDNSIMRKLLTFLIGIFLTVTLLGCHDPVAADREIEHRTLMNIFSRVYVLNHRLHKHKRYIQHHKLLRLITKSFK